MERTTLETPPEWYSKIGVLYQAGLKEWFEGDLHIHRLGGGTNNALYRIDSAGKRYACKLCVKDERRRVVREYNSLQLLEQSGLDIAPHPYWVDESCDTLPYPCVVYGWLDGEPVGLNDQQLSGVSKTYQALHELQPAHWVGNQLPTAWFHWFDFEPYLSELQEFLITYGKWLAAFDLGGGALYDRLAWLVQDCIRTLRKPGTPSPARESLPLRLCRVDPNRSNTVWGPDAKVRWVDWEYCGWGDPALDLADLRWHAAWEVLTEAQHGMLREQYQPPQEDASFTDRLVAWDRLVSTRWPFLILRLLWSCYNGSDRVRLTQVEEDPIELWRRLIRFIERAELYATA